MGGEENSRALQPSTLSIPSPLCHASLPFLSTLSSSSISGDPFVNYLSVTPIHDARGVLTHYVGVQSDITELVASRKAALAARHAAQTAAAATEAKSQFLARMSHEIRTPLNGMIAVGQLLAETALTPAQWDLVNTIRCSGESLLTLISDILDFSRAEADAVALAPAPFALQATVEAAVEIAGLLAAHKRLHVAYYISPCTPPVLVGDAARLQQVLLNILNNAVKFTEVGGVVLEVWVGGDGGGGGSVAPAAAAAAAPAAPPPPPLPPAAAGNGADAPAPAAPAPAPGAPFSSSSPSSSGLPPLPPPPPDAVRVCFCVRDTGIGLALDDIPRLFQSFSQVDASPTRRHGGSGLGLAISQKLCAAMGGRVDVASPGPGQGSTFTWSVLMRLPGPGVPRPLLPPPGRGGPGARALLAGKKVLLAEPCGLVQAVLERALVGWGAAVATVASEGEAIARLALPPGGESAATAAAAPPPPPDCGLTLRGCGEADATPPSTSQPPMKGPFDLVIMDTGAACLLRALLHAPPAEAARVVFVGWPGRHEMETAVGTVEEEDEDGEGRQPPPTMAEDDASSLLTALTVAAGAAAARLGGPGGGGGGGAATAAAAVAGAPGGGLRAAAAPAAAVRGGSGRASGGAAAVLTGRRLGYTVLTRPVRQARLWVAIEEVMSAPLPPEEEEEEEGGGGRGGDEWAGFGASGAPPHLPAPSSDDGRPGHARSTVPPRPPTRSASSIDLGATEHMHRIASGGALHRAPPSRARRAGSGGLGAGAGSGALPDLSPPASDAGVEAGGGGGRGGGGAGLLSSTPAPPWTVAQQQQQQARTPAAQAGTSGRTGAPGGASGSGLRVLVAEDNAINMRVALAVLDRMGHTRVTRAEDGQAALEAVAAAGGLDAFDVILMDLHMPRLGGLAAVRALREAYPAARTRIVAVTADAFDTARDACLAAGFQSFVSKPFRVEELSAALTAEREDVRVRVEGR